MQIKLLNSFRKVLPVQNHICDVWLSSHDRYISRFACNTRNHVDRRFYDGEAMKGPVKVVVRVTIDDQNITDINLVKHTAWKGRTAGNIIVHRIVSNQSNKMDCVSGATTSSETIMQAVRNALDTFR